MTDRPDPTAAPDDPTLTRVALRLCSLCLNGEGGECHTAGCALWLKRAPDLRLDPETDYEVLTDDPASLRAEVDDTLGGTPPSLGADELESMEIEQNRQLVDALTEAMGLLQHVNPDYTIDDWRALAKDVDTLKEKLRNG